MPAKLFTRAKNGASEKITAPKTTPEILVNIDFPQEEEKVMVGHYAIRITTRVGGPVELSINKSDWKHCRAGVGYHWFDWKPEDVGSCKIEARLKTANGQYKKSNIRSCTIIKPKKS